MPYASDAQRRWAHTEMGTRQLGGKRKVKEWDRMTKGKHLPEKASSAKNPFRLAYERKVA